MDRSKLLTILVGIVACAALVGTGVLLKRNTIGMEIGLPVLGFLGAVLWGLRSYLGLGGTPPAPPAVLMVFALGSVLVMTPAACSPASQQMAQKQIEYKVEEGLHSKELGECIADTKADAGTFADFCVCWNGKNAKYHVDAGTECKR